jgi:hypothetical protein
VVTSRGVSNLRITTLPPHSRKSFISASREIVGSMRISGRSIAYFGGNGCSPGCSSTRGLGMSSGINTLPPRAAISLSVGA